MITYKGQKTVIGKRFFYEDELVKYNGKIYGDQFSFMSEDNTEYILTESDLIKLKEYNINGEDTNTVKDIDNDDVLRDTILDYAEKEIALLSDLLVGKETDVNKLNEIYQNEYDDLIFLNKYELYNNRDTDIPLENQLRYFKDINRNISGVNIVELLTSLNDFINSNKGGNK